MTRFKYKDYELVEFKPGLKLVGFHVYKDGKMFGVVVAGEGMWRVHVVKEDEYIGICDVGLVEQALGAMEAYYKKIGESNVIDFKKFKEKKCSE